MSKSSIVILSTLDSTAPTASSSMNGDAELASVKASVKAWEKAFRAEHGREPTKADIKGDESNIAEQYALYRKLSKAAKPTTSRSGASSKSRASAEAKSSHSNGSAAPTHEPTTPTPQRRRSTLPSPPQRPALLADNGAADKKRAAPSTPQRTPKRTKAYTGPVYDPNPNPFSVTPKKRATPIATSPFKSFAASTKTGSASKGPVNDSPFLIANSPQKLKELLKANSLQARKQREVEKNTPRTRARKRLAGEVVDDSPVAVRRRGQGQAKAPVKVSPEPFGDAFQTAEDEDDDDELGETPLKPGVDAFTLLASVGKPKQPNLGAPLKKAEGATDLFPMFKRAVAAKTKSSSPPPAMDEVDEVPQSPVPSDTALPAVEAEPDLNMDIDEVKPVPTLKRTEREHILDLSDDEWDPEASPRRLRITGTRRQAVRLRPDVIASEDEGDGAVEHEDVFEDDSEEEFGSDEPPPPDENSMLSLLSLRSPGKRRDDRLADLRVRALLDPNSAAAVALRAHQRGQDVFTSGEGVEAEEEDVLDEGAVFNDGDDDWESDPEGWKVETQEEAW